MFQVREDGIRRRRAPPGAFQSQALANKQKGKLANVVKAQIFRSRRTGQPLPDALAARYPFLVGQLGDPDPQYVDIPDLGFAFALPAISALSPVKALTSLPSKIPVIGGVFKKNKDPGRLQSNAEAYQLAISGNNQAYKGHPNGLAFLLAMSTAWATSKAKDDARAKYNQAKPIVEQQAKAAKANVTQGGTIAIKPATQPVLKPPVAGPRPRPQILTRPQPQQPGGYQPSSGGGGMRPGGTTITESDITGGGEGAPTGGMGSAPLILGAAALAVFALTRSGGSRSW